MSAHRPFLLIADAYLAVGPGARFVARAKRTGIEPERPKLLGVSRRTFYNKLAELELDGEQ